MLSKADFSRLRSLREKKHREQMGQFVVEGEKVVGELLAAGFAFQEILATPEWQAPAGVPNVREITAAEMARISHFPTAAGVFALGALRRVPLGAGALARGLTLALDGVQDPGNVGTLIRIADWFGLDRMLLSPDSADLFHQKVINASMGSFARMTVHTANLTEALTDVTVPVIGCDLAGDNVHHLPVMENAIIVIGSEGRGLSPAVKARLTQTVTIPRSGAAESLNAAVAAAVVCDNLRRALAR